MSYVHVECTAPSYELFTWPKTYCIQPEINGTCPPGTSQAGGSTCSDWVNPCPPNASRVAIKGVPNQACQCNPGYSSSDQYTCELDGSDLPWSPLTPGTPVTPPTPPSHGSSDTEMAIIAGIALVAFFFLKR